MQKDKLLKYKKILMDEKIRLKDEIKNFQDEEKYSQQESTAELSSYDNHPGDAGSETFEREMDLGLKDNTFSLLKQVDDALTKIESGNYGFCQKCGIDIKEERLEVLPYTSFCKECQQNSENLEGVRERPIEEGSFYPPFRGFNDETGDVEYDAEDTWQAVAQYGTSNDPSYAHDPVTGEKLSKDPYIDSDEIVGAVGIEDTLIDDQVEDLEGAAKKKTTFTGIQGDSRK